MARTTLCVQIKKEYYMFERSTIVDAPTTYILTIDEYLKFYKEMYWDIWLENLDVEYLKKHWSIWIPCRYKNVRDLVKWNRAWKNETTLSYKKLIDAYLYKLDS